MVQSQLVLKTAYELNQGVSQLRDKALADAQSQARLSRSTNLARKVSWHLIFPSCPILLQATSSTVELGRNSLTSTPTTPSLGRLEKTRAGRISLAVSELRPRYPFPS